MRRWGALSIGVERGGTDGPTQSTEDGGHDGVAAGAPAGVSGSGGRGGGAGGAGGEEWGGCGCGDRGGLGDAWLCGGVPATQELATQELVALEAWLDAHRPTGYVAQGWRERTLVTRMGDVRVRRRRYRAPDGISHFLVDEHLGWLPGQVATPAFTALLVEWASDVPFRAAARRLAAVTAGAVSGSTAWRAVQQVAGRVTAQEQTAHAAWADTATLPAPEGERVVPVLYLEAAGVWVKTQREPPHRTGYERKCASVSEGWEQLAGPTAGHPRPHYRLRKKQVYCHGFARADAKAPPPSVPFWEAIDLALARMYDVSRVPVVVVGGDGANWIDTAPAHFPQGVRQRDGFHLARDVARGWGTAAGATL